MKIDRPMTNNATKIAMPAAIPMIAPVFLDKSLPPDCVFPIDGWVMLGCVTIVVVYITKFVVGTPSVGLLWTTKDSVTSTMVLWLDSPAPEVDGMLAVTVSFAWSEDAPCSVAVAIEVEAIN